MWFLKKKERQTILEAAKALKIFNGHDSYANLRHNYGEDWWNEITRIEKDLRDLVK